MAERVRRGVELVVVGRPHAQFCARSGALRTAARMPRGGRRAAFARPLQRGRLEGAHTKAQVLHAGGRQGAGSYARTKAGRALLLAAGRAAAAGAGRAAGSHADGARRQRHAEDRRSRRLLHLAAEVAVTSRAALVDEPAGEMSVGKHVERESAVQKETFSQYLEVTKNNFLNILYSTGLLAGA